MSDEKTPTPDQQINAMRRIDAFLKDEAVSAALGRMERRFYEEFLKADSSEARVRAWAKANVLRDFEHEMKVTLGAGEREVLNAAAKAKRDAKESNRRT